MKEKRKELRVHLLNVGHGCNIIIQFPDDTFGVVDCYLAEKTINYLAKLSAAELQFICATHPHADHSLGIPNLMREYSGRIRQLWHCGFPHPSRTDALILKLAELDQNIVCIYQRAGTQINIGGVSLTVLSPSQRLYNQFLNYQTDINDASIVLKLTYNRSEMILGSDALARSWGEIMADFPAKGGLNCQTLVVPHHGSDNGIPFGLLRQMKPRHALISASAQTIHGIQFPDKTTVQMLTRIGCTIYNTADVDAEGKPKGSIVVRMNGTNRPFIERLGDAVDEHPNPTTTTKYTK
jgi:beta-lactamase superfamily II metal-dependent hydrolase